VHRQRGVDVHLGRRRLLHDEVEQRREILALVAEGMSNREIADRLVLSPETVKSHVAAILEKLNVSDRTQAAIFAVRNGLVEASPS
jgi:DNA-binding NarL/FixJ family response regulator